jgi:hypothetical protein
MEASHERREGQLAELIRALLALAGHETTVRVLAPDGSTQLSLRGQLTRPYRQPLDPDVITLGFALSGLSLDLHLHQIADLRRWDFRLGERSAVGLRLLLIDDTVIQIDQSTKEGQNNSHPT